MKKAIKRISSGLLVVAFVFSSKNFFTTYVSGANGVIASSKKSTVIISGKGKMKNSMTFKNKKKIKKVIVKNNVTSISKRAFYGCKNLKILRLGKRVKAIGRYAFYNTRLNKVVIPKSVKSIGVGAFNTKTEIKSASIPGTIKTKTVVDMESSVIMSNVNNVTFITNLDINILNNIKAKNYVVKNNDKKYSSKDGIVYSKDGSKVVRIPNRKEVVIADGCKEFDIYAYKYATYLGDDYYEAICKDVQKIVLPKSVSKITDSSVLKEQYVFYNDQYGLKELEIQNKNLDAESIKLIKEALGNNYEMITTDSSILFKSIK